MKRRPILMLTMLLIIMFTIAASTYAFAAANTVPVNKAGDGSGAISGYSVSSVHYVLNATNPTLIDSVTFTLDSAPVAGSTIKIKLVSAGSNLVAPGARPQQLILRQGQFLPEQIRTSYCWKCHYYACSII